MVALPAASRRRTIPIDGKSMEQTAHLCDNGRGTLTEEDAMKALKTAVSAAILWVMLGGCLARAETMNTAVEPPVAAVIPHTLEKHGDVRVDNYFWLNERDNPEVIAYLEAENKYTDEVMAPVKGLEDTLFAEITGRIKQTDMSVPYKLDDYYYYTRYEEGQEYPIYCRKEGSLAGAEEAMLDVNPLAKGHEFFSARNTQISYGQNILSYAVDTVGRRFYTLYFKNLQTGETLGDMIPDVTGNTAWANDNKTIFYTKQDPATLRWFQVYRHVLGTNSAEDELVYEETDETFSVTVFRTKSKKYIMISSQQTLSSEYRFLDANDPNGAFAVFAPRERDHEYHVDHYKDYFYIRTNNDADNFRLMKTPVTATAMDRWVEVIPYRPDVLLEEFEIFRDYLVLAERSKGLIQLRVIPWDGGEEHYIDFGEPAYLAYISTNPEFNTALLRYGYSSMTTPTSIFDYDMAARTKTLLKQEEVLGGFDSGNYQTERLYATASDGVEVPISLVYRKGLNKDGSNPLLLYGYGSYGYSTEASFNSARLSLLDRGFVYAIAHVRGGEECGRRWYEDGKLLKKKNTFTDFIACAEYLIAGGYTNKDRLFAMGGSAGGLLMGAVANMRPDLFKGIIALVPWVDVVTTMLDESIPLTTSEYDEWGNPNDKTYYDYMLSYSPYDNVEAKAYPNMLVTTGLHDSQVQYWEPAKWVAKLRALKTNDTLVLLKTNMEAGHSGRTGRFKRYRDTAFQYAFMLDLMGIRE
jgi:oligopeptidase B